MIESAVVVFHTKAGKIYQIPCHRHGDAFYIIKQFIPSPDEIDKTKIFQGFIDDKGNILNRMDAKIHAVECGQVRLLGGDDYAELYSEDLW